MHDPQKRKEEEEKKIFSENRRWAHHQRETTFTLEAKGAQLAHTQLSLSGLRESSPLFYFPSPHLVTHTHAKF